jgi:hypothetical protein
MSRQAKSSRWVPGDPEWEAVSAQRSSMSHAAAALVCEQLTERYRDLWHRRALGMVALKDILRTLRTKKVPFVLTGYYGISGWTGQPRATHDVDILVKAGRNYARAVKALRDLYPELETRQFAGVTAFFLPGEVQSLIDVTYPHRADIAETLATAIWVEDHGERYRVPTLEAALANKYGAMVTLSRDLLKRGQDAIDFGLMVRHSGDPGRQPIDLERLEELGEKVWPGGGGAEILRLVEDVRQGRMPNVNPPAEPGG